MIVKSMTRKTGSFLQLLHYFIKSEADEASRITHNLQSRPQAVGRIYEEFESNSKHIKKRKQGVVLYHEILSLSNEDKKQITPAILKDLGEKYLELRAGQALAFGAVHLNTGTPHIHLMISANLLESSKKLRVNKKRFDAIKRELEAYQKMRYPFLLHSVAFGERGKSKHASRKEEERKRRLKKEGQETPSKKEVVKNIIATAMSEALSQSEFANKLKGKGFELYRRGKSVGVVEVSSGKKYRLKTLGLAEAYKEALVSFRKISRRKEELKQSLNKSRERGGRSR